MEKQKKYLNYEVDCDNQSSVHENHVRSPWGDCDLAGDTVQEESNLLGPKCPRSPARYRGVLHTRHQEEPGVAMVKICSLFYQHLRLPILAITVRPEIRAFN